MNVRSYLKTLLAALTVALAFVVLLTSCGGSGAIKEPLNSEELSGSGNLSESGDAPDGDSSADSHDDDETPEPPKTAYCFYIKDAQLYFVDSISKTPIRLTENLCPLSSDIEYLKTFAGTLLPSYFDSGRIVLFSDNGNMNLYYRDVSDPNGSSVKVSDGVLNGYNSYKNTDRAIIYTTTDNVRRVYNIDTGEYGIYQAAGSSVSDNSQGNADNYDESKHTIAKYDSGEKYYYTKNTVDGKTKSLDFYYTDGSSDTFLCSVDSMYHEEHSDYIPLMSIYINNHTTTKNTPEVMVFSKGRVYTLDFEKFKGYSVYESVVDHKKECVYFVVAKDSGSEYNGLYSFSPLTASNNEPECVDPYIAKLQSNTDYCWRDWMGNLFYLHKDGALCCNNGENILDDSQNKNRILGFFGNTLLYAVGQQSPTGTFYKDKPYTLMAATANKSVRIADNILSIRKHALTNALWVIGDYDALTMTGTLYLYENEEAVVYDTNVIEMILD